MAASTADVSACTRTSGLASGASAGAITCQPRSFVKVRHCAASAPSTKTMAGDFAGASCAAATARARRLIMPQARTNFLDQLLDFIDLFERGEGENVAVVHFQFLLQLFGQVGQLGRVLQVLLVLGLQNLIALELPVGQANRGFVFSLGLRAPPAALRHRKAGDGRE